MDAQKGNYGTMLARIILDKLPQDEKLLITKTMAEEIWDLIQILELLTQELKTKEAFLSSATCGECFSEYTGSILHSNLYNNKHLQKRAQKSCFKIIFSCKGL